MSGSSDARNLKASRLVLDSWPVLEWARGREPGKTAFRSFLERSAQGTLSLYISRINVGEIHYNAVQRHGAVAASVIRQELRLACVEMASVTDMNVDAAADLKARYKLSYADAFAAVLSMERDAPLATGDRDFLALAADGLIRVHWMGA